MMNTDRGHQIVGLCGFTLAQAAEAAEAIRAGINAALDV
jgi:ABC-type amino acid transport system permease subunit